MSSFHVRVDKCGVAMSQHCHQWNNSRAACNEKKRSSKGYIPNEVSTDWTAQLELIPGSKLFGEIRGNFPIPQSLDGKREMSILWSRRDRIASLRLIPVLSSESHIDVLSSAMTRPLRYVENERSRPRRFWYDIGDSCDAPSNSRRTYNGIHSSPAYRCSRHGSP